nr:hypothetical protein CFP56_28635 [Quercus suber]
MLQPTTVHGHARPQTFQMRYGHGEKCEDDFVRFVVGVTAMPSTNKPGIRSKTSRPTDQMSLLPDMGHRDGTNRTLSHDTLCCVRMKCFKISYSFTEMGQPKNSAWYA